MTRQAAAGVADTAVKLRAGATTATALLEAALARIAVQPGAFTQVAADRARADAAESDARLRAGRARSPLEGVPVSVKDLFDVAGEVTRAGSRVLACASPAVQHAPVVARLRAAGAVIVGRTHMSAFAFTGLGDNPHLPRCPHPHDPDRVPGGSSSGAAVSVALEQAVVGLGTDTGGSVRIPAAFCGLTGFKPTQRRVSRAGAFVLSPSQDSIGPIARHVSCCAIVDQVLAGEPVVPLPGVALAGRRLGVPGDYVMEGLDPVVARAFDRGLSRLSRAGVSITTFRCPSLADLPDLFARGTIVNAEAFAHHAASGLLAQRAAYDPMVIARIDMGGRMSADDVARLVAARTRLRVEMDRLSAGFDALVLPTTPNLPPRFDAIADPAVFARQNGLALRNTSLFNFLDRCAISLPLDTGDELPVGLMLVGETMGDRALLALAQAVEGVVTARAG